MPGAHERPEPELNETRATEPDGTPAKELDEMPESALATEQDGTPASASEAVETPEPSLLLWERNGPARQIRGATDIQAAPPDAPHPANSDTPGP